MYLGCRNEHDESMDTPLSFKSFLEFGERRGEFKKTRSRTHEKGAKRNLIGVYIACSGRNKPRYQTNRA